MSYRRSHLNTTMSTGSLERGSQPPTNAPRTPTTQLVVSQASLLNSTPLNRGTPIQDGEAKIPLYARTGLVGRATTVYECDLADHPSKELVVTLSWSEVSGTLEPEVLKELGGIPEQEVKGHIPALLASEMSMVMDTCLIRKRLCTTPQLHFPRPRVITVCQKRRAVWDLTADDFFNDWMRAVSCMLGRSMSGCSRLTRFRSHHSVGKRFLSPRYQPQEYGVLL